MAKFWILILFLHKSNKTPVEINKSISLRYLLDGHTGPPKKCHPVDFPAGHVTNHAHLPSGCRLYREKVN